MRILIYGINYTPELTGIGKYTGEMAEWLVTQGHEVHVITALPYYPEWNVHEKYKGKRWHTENLNGVQVHRCPLYVPKVVDSKKRIIHEFSFVISTLPFWAKLMFKKKFDIVFSIAPPFHLGFLPVLYKSLRRSNLVTHIQDLQVDAAKDLGMIKNKTFLNVMFGMERWILKRSTRVSTISTGMQRKIQDKGIPIEKLMQFPNWVDETVIMPLGKEASMRKVLNISGETKVVLYSGNLGEKQGLEIIIDVAAGFENEKKDVLFLICGSGGGKEKLMEMVRNAGLTNIHFLPLQPYAQLSSLLATADVHLVLQKGSAADLVLPSKLTGILAAGGCAIVTAVPGTSLYDIVNDRKIGILIQPESVVALTDGIQLALFSDVSKIKENARKYAETGLSKNGIMRIFEENLKTIVNQVPNFNH